MARLAISADFQRDYARLEAPVRRRIDELTAKFREHTHAGLHLETHRGQRDPRARTIRINDFYRGIVLAPESGDLFVLTRVLTHDDAERWMAQNEFRINEATGALEVFNIVEMEKAVDASDKPATTVDLFDHRRDKDFVDLGVTALPAQTLRRVAHEDELQHLLGLLPPLQAEAVIELLGDESVEDIYARLVAEPAPSEVDTEDVAAALDRSSTRVAFHVVATDDELRQMLDQPLALWRTYLHPTQHQLAYRPQYNGPVRVTGGPGTGKTVVAIHRAKALVDALPGSTGKRILVTTFTRNLAAALERDLAQLGGPELAAQVDVTNIDALAHRIVREEERTAPRIANDDEQAERWRAVVSDLALPYSPTFLAAEWTHVVLAQGIRSRDEYLRASRSGRGVRLSRAQRNDVWRAIDSFLADLAASNVRSFLQLAADASRLLLRTGPRYDHVIVDEAQDLHEAQWRLIRALVPEHPNDLFIVGDSHQRIYSSRASLRQVGIHIVGRSHQLRTCYRTTRQILKWSLAVLGNGEFDDLDEGTDTLTGYRSWLSGPPPSLHAAPNRAAEYDELAEVVAAWIDGGFAADGIVVTARTSASLHTAAVSLERVGLEVHELGGEVDDGPDNAVRLATMHRMKGLEFRCVAILDANDTTIPLEATICSPAVDKAQHEMDMLRERCLLYVASTRARDSLAVLWYGEPSPFLEPMWTRT